MIEGTTCTITEIDGYYSYNVRLTLFHGRESTVKELEQHKPALIDSMEYLMSMIYNATGKEPHEMRFIIEDAWD